MSQGCNTNTTWEANSTLDTPNSGDARLDSGGGINKDSKQEGNPIFKDDKKATVNQEASQNLDGNQDTILRLRIKLAFDLVFPLNNDGSCYRLDFYRTPWGYKQHLMDELRASNLPVCEDVNGT